MREPEDVEEAPPRRRPWRRGPVVLVLLLLVGAAGAIWALGRDAEPARATVPAVVRLAERDAAKRLGDEGLTVVVDRRRNDDVGRGLVSEQRPAAGSEVEPGAIVTVVVASGPATTDVPDVTGLAAGRAAETLRAAHLRAEPVQVFSDRPPGTVVAQHPRAAQRAGWLAAVRITVSRGSTRRTVPNVVGGTVAAARAAFRRAGLGAPRVARVGAAPAAGTVVAQTPVGGSRVAGGTVRIDVSDGGGPPDTPPAENPHTPLVLGFGASEAMAELERYGYRVRVRYRRTAMTIEDGTVVEQSPAEGAPAGSVITLVVGAADL